MAGEISASKQQQLDEQLVAAARLGDSQAAEKVKTLIQLGANPSAKVSYFPWLGPCSALVAAVAKGKEAMALALVDAGADPSSRDEEGRTAFLWAARNGMGKLAEALGPLSDGSLRDSSGAHPLVLAATAAAGTSCLMAIAKFAPPSAADLNLSLMKASAACGMERRNGDECEDKEQEQTSELAAMWLLSMGAHPSKTLNADGEDALIVALRCERGTLAEAMIAHGADLQLVSRSGDTALSWAAARGEEACVRAIARECDVNQQLPDGRTPLMQALQYARGKDAEACIDFLLSISDIHSTRPRRLGDVGEETLLQFARRISPQWAVAAVEREFSRRKALSEREELSSAAELGTGAAKPRARVL